MNYRTRLPEFLTLIAHLRRPAIAAPRATARVTARPQPQRFAAQSARPESVAPAP